MRSSPSWISAASVSQRTRPLSLMGFTTNQCEHHHTNRSASWWYRISYYIYSIIYQLYYVVSLHHCILASEILSFTKQWNLWVVSYFVVYVLYWIDGQRFYALYFIWYNYIDYHNSLWVKTPWHKLVQKPADKGWKRCQLPLPPWIPGHIHWRPSNPMGGAGELVKLERLSLLQCNYDIFSCMHHR